MAYGNDTEQDPSTGEKILEWGEEIYSWFGGEQQTGLPNLPPLPYSPTEVAQQIQANPEFGNRLRSHLQPYAEPIGRLMLGRAVTAEDWTDPFTLAAIALWHSGAPGRDINVEEEQTRQMVTAEMESAGFQLPGTDIRIPTGTAGAGGGAALAIIGGLIGLAIWAGQ